MIGKKYLIAWIRPAIWCLVCAVMLPSSLKADIIVLQNGQKIEGVILSEDEETYQVQVSKTTFILQKDRIKTVVKEPPDTTLVRLGDEAFHKRRFQEARGYYLKALGITTEKDVVTERLNLVARTVYQEVELPRAEAAFKSGSYRRAADLYLGLLAKYPGEAFTTELKQGAAQAYYFLAREAFAQLRDRDGYLMIQQALTSDPGAPQVHLLLGEQLLRHKKSRLAAEEFAIVLAYDPSNKAAATWLAEIGAQFTEQEIAALGRDAGKKPFNLDYLYDDQLLMRRTHRVVAEQIKESTPEKKNLETLSLLLQAYNAGPWAVVSYKGNVRYKETVGYVAKVLHWLRNDLPQSEYDHLIMKYAQRYELDPRLVKAIIKVESNFDPRCVSRVDARGLMQIVREDWDDTMQRLGETWSFDDNVFDPDKNIHVGCHYLNWLRRDFLPTFFSDISG
jgi:tetratricopeptide (TPR) repeat protein